MGIQNLIAQETREAAWLTHKTLHTSKFTFPAPLCLFCEEEMELARQDHSDIDTGVNEEEEYAKTAEVEHD
jgi:hypothetical protein